MLKNILKFFSLLFVLGFSCFSLVQAAFGEVDSFEIKLIDRVQIYKPGSQISYQISALDSNGNIVTDYDGTVLIFSESDRDADFLGAQDNVYIFDSNNRGVAIFRPGVTFSLSGINDIHVYDLNDGGNEVMGNLDIYLEKGDGSYASPIEYKYVRDNIIFGVNEAHHYDISLSNNDPKIGEPLDLKIDVMNVNGEVLTNYQGTVLVFSESDVDAAFFGLEDQTYTFNKDDNGTVILKGGVSFSKIGTHDIHVYDLEDETNTVMGMIEVNVGPEVYVKKESNAVVTGGMYGNNTVSELELIAPYVGALDKKINTLFSKLESKSDVYKLVFYMKLLDKLVTMTYSEEISKNKTKLAIIKYIVEAVENVADELDGYEIDFGFLAKEQVAMGVLTQKQGAILERMPLVTETGEMRELMLGNFVFIFLHIDNDGERSKWINFTISNIEGYSKLSSYEKTEIINILKEFDESFYN